jgi:predicted nucleotidyltransferase
MISDADKAIIVACAEKYNVSRVVLFGSAIGEADKANDFDIAVKGIRPELFFKFYAELFKRLSKPVDLVDLSRKSLFNELVEQTGVVIYG